MPTTDIQITPFKAEDAFDMQLTESSLAAFTSGDLLRESVLLYERKGPGWTMRVGDQIIGCSGLMFPWATRSLAVAWLLPSPLLPSYPKTAILALLTRLRALIREHEPRRIEFFVSTTFHTGQRFAEFMGFWRDGHCDPPCEQCGLIKAYGPNGEDFIRYVWLREGEP